VDLQNDQKVQHPLYHEMREHKNLDLYFLMGVILGHQRMKMHQFMSREYLFLHTLTHLLSREVHRERQYIVFFTQR
jgi:hypothetical protein